MKVQFQNGNNYTIAFDAGDKTLTVTNLFNADVTPYNLEVYNTTRTAWMIGGDSTAVGTVAITSSAGLPIFTLTLDKVPASSANNDTLVTYIEIPNPEALQNSSDFIGEKP
jgi:hypothetical protein